MTVTLMGLLIVVACAVIEGLAQVLLKKSTSAGSLARLWLALGVGLFLLEAVLYTAALQFLNVSIAYTVGSLSFVTVTLLSAWLLRERVTRIRWLGVAMILLGAALVAARA